ncbi:MAG: helix-turn-helix domain-containing protein [Gemmataceae bacterium]
MANQTRAAKRRIDVTVDGTRVVLPPDLKAAVRRAVEAAAKPLPAEMTTTQAADFLDVSRPFVVKLIRRGDLPCRMVGTHRRIPSEALVRYRETMYQRAREAAAEITRISEDLGLYERDDTRPE